MSAAWAFATRAWERPGVAAICLDLQEHHGQCAALLLWRLWALAEGRLADRGPVARALDIARAWNATVIEPLRTIRGRLAVGTERGADAGLIPLRERLLAAELEAEHVLLVALEAVTGGPAGADREPPLPALVALAEAWRAPAPASLLAALLNAL